MSCGGCREYHYLQVVTTTRKKRIARAVAVWINVAQSQLVKDAGLVH